MNNPAPAARTAANILVDQLRLHGTDIVFCVPGESYLAVLDSLYEVREAVRLIVARQDGGASYMAEAYGKLTGKPGICFVTRGPGATNASIGVHLAQQDSTPMILFIGQVGSDFAEREAFQEIDYTRMYGGIAKWVTRIDRADRIPEFVSRAYHTACSGRPGPVVLALPEDMLTTTATVADAAPYKAVQPHAGHSELGQVMALLERAERPFMMVGGSGWTAAASTGIQRFAEANNLPVGVSFRRQDIFDNRHPNYAGDIGIGVNPKLAQRVRDADVLLVVGARLGEMTTNGYTLLEAPRPKQKLIHVHPDANELNRVYEADLSINAGVAPFGEAVASLAGVGGIRWDAWTRGANADYRANIEPVAMPGPVNLSEIIAWLRERLPRDALIVNGAGNFSGWVHRFYQYTPLRTEVAPTNGTMGYGVPAGVAAKLTHPDRVVVSFSGDGCFLMNGQEIATARQYGANVVFIVVNNGMYGTIRMHQEREYPGRVWGTDLVNPDFVALARAHGLQGELVERTADFAPAFERALACGKPALLELRIDPEAITTRTTLSEIRAKALKR